LIAHVAANADALGNLVHWAATGEPTPMYSSPADRAAGIEAGRRLPPHELVRWVRRSAAELEEKMTRLTDEQWQALVVTAQGRAVPATEVPWLRSREVCVHAADLATGLRFGGQGLLPGAGGELLQALPLAGDPRAGAQRLADGAGGGSDRGLDFVPLVERQTAWCGGRRQATGPVMPRRAVQRRQAGRSIRRNTPGPRR
jgi:uncharacterized protein (TIGR03083 family)